MHRSNLFFSASKNSPLFTFLPPLNMWGIDRGYLPLLESLKKSKIRYFIAENRIFKIWPYGGKWPFLKTKNGLPYAGINLSATIGPPKPLKTPINHINSVREHVSRHFWWKPQLRFSHPWPVAGLWGFSPRGPLRSLWDSSRNPLGKTLWAQPRVKGGKTEVGVFTKNVGKHVLSPN